MSNVLVLGSQWGDEGKGKIVDLLAEKAYCVVRFQGGSNAGHTVIKDGKKYILHLMPSGILYPDKKCFIANGAVIDLHALNTEIQTLSEQGININKNLFISDKAHVVMPYHKLIDANREISLDTAKIGTTGKGIGPVYQDKIGRLGIRIGEIKDSPSFKERVFGLIEEKQKFLNYILNFNKFVMDKEEIYDHLLKQFEPLKKYVVDTIHELLKINASHSDILFEGAQGSFLDVDHGTYPYVTSSNTTAGGACTGTGLPPSSINHVIGVVKAYTTRVGEGPFPTELNDDTGKKIQSIGNEVGATTGRERRCGWFDAALVRRSVRINGINSLALTKIDVLDEFDTIKICTSYRLKDGTAIDYPPADIDDFEDLTPIYEELPGWKSTTSGITDYDKLPANSKKYLDRISELLDGVPISILSVGPRNKETIFLKDPFNS